MKMYLLALTLLLILSTTQIKASVSDEAEDIPQNQIKASVSKVAEDILQTYFPKDKTFKKHARKALRVVIIDSDEQEKLMNAVVLYRTGIQSARDLSKLFDLLKQHMLSETFDTFTSSVDTVIEAYSNDQGTLSAFKLDRLKGEALLESMNILSSIQEKGFLTAATRAIVKFVTIPEFETYLNFSRLYLVNYFLRPLSEKKSWNDELTNEVMRVLREKIDKFKKSGGHINVMNIGSLYGATKRLIEKS
ncbi:MAG TPA: hypothetical protein DD412_03955 [Holosporales bacterium]|nr:hypothetical protein [Holosporales bacterium]